MNKTATKTAEEILFEVIKEDVQRYGFIDIGDVVKKAMKQYAEQAIDRCAEEKIWFKWMTNYPKKNGLYLITPRGKSQTWVGYWNNARRRFEEAVPEFTDKGIDVDWWAEMPVNPNCITVEKDSILKIKNNLQ